MRLVRDSGLGRNEKAVLFALALRADEAGECFPGFGTLAKDTGLSWSTIKRTIPTLPATGFIAVAGGPNGTPNRYRLLVPKAVDPGHQDHGQETDPGQTDPGQNADHGHRDLGGDNDPGHGERYPGHRDPLSNPEEIREEDLRGSALPPAPPPVDEPDDKPRRKRRHALPDGWAPNPEHQGRAAKLRVNLERERERFCLHAQQTGRVMANWDAAFTTWLIKADEFAARDGPRSSSTRLRQPNYYDNTDEFLASINVEVIR